MSNTQSMQKYGQDKAIAELKYQATMLEHQAACLAENGEDEQQCRAKLHALLDVILDSGHLLTYCALKQLRNPDNG